MEEKEILTKREQFINLIFYIFRYILYIIAFTCLVVNIGKFFTILVASLFLILSQLHTEYSEKIQKSIIAEEINKHDEVTKFYIKNR